MLDEPSAIAVVPGHATSQPPLHFVLVTVAGLPSSASPIGGASTGRTRTQPHRIRPPDGEAYVKEVVRRHGPGQIWTANPPVRQRVVLGLRIMATNTAGSSLLGSKGRQVAGHPPKRALSGRAVEVPRDRVSALPRPGGVAEPPPPVPERCPSIGRGTARPFANQRSCPARCRRVGPVERRIPAQVAHHPDNRQKNPSMCRPCSRLRQFSVLPLGRLCCQNTPV